MQAGYDAAVIGAGIFGAWTAYELNKAGLRVALVDAYGAGNSRSSSGDESRIIRMSYGANEIYTRWSWRALKLWKDFCAETGATLFHQTGVLLLAQGAFAHALDSEKTLTAQGIPFERLDRDELERRFPQFDFSNVDWAIYEPESGALMARRAVQTVTQAAIQRGVSFFNEAVLPPTGTGLLTALTTTNGDKLHADQFVFACGPWLPKLFPALLGERIHVTRQEVFYFGTPPGDARFSAPHCPTWIDFAAEVYGLPSLEARGFKVAPDRHGAAFDPDRDERVCTADALQTARQTLARRFPALQDAPLVETRVCQYENTSNGDFLIDRHPDFSNVWLVGGGSGHGFKHGPALGEYVAARIVANAQVEPEFSLATKATVRARTIY
jgi:monomeric sarcosine oxidase